MPIIDSIFIQFTGHLTVGHTRLHQSYLFFVSWQICWFVDLIDMMLELFYRLPSSCCCCYWQLTTGTTTARTTTITKTSSYWRIADILWQSVCGFQLRQSITIPPNPPPCPTVAFVIQLTRLKHTHDITEGSDGRKEAQKKPNTPLTDATFLLCRKWGLKWKGGVSVLTTDRRQTTTKSRTFC